MFLACLFHSFYVSFHRSFIFQPELIPDPEASKPNDWDNDMDGDWEPPMIDNPACKGVSGCGPWKKPLVSNPLYKVVSLFREIAQ